MGKMEFNCLVREAKESLKYDLSYSIWCFIEIFRVGVLGLKRNGD